MRGESDEGEEGPAGPSPGAGSSDGRLKRWALRWADRLGVTREWRLIVVGAAIGVVTGLAAVGFIELLHLVEGGAVEMRRHWSLWLLPLPPMVGALFTGLLVHHFAREAKGHGVPEVMRALLKSGGKIRPRVALVKSVASVCTIGSGGSAGAEGPIVQIGSAIGSGLAQALRVGREHSGTLLGCGAAAGIASVFNAPIAGVFFVLEILLRDFSLKTFTPIVVASVFSAATTQAVLGKNQAIFGSPSALQHHQFTLAELPSYAALGLVCGLLSAGFVRMLYASEDLADRVRVHPVVKPVAGAFGLGLLGIGFLLAASAAGAKQDLPWFFGNGYEAIRRLLDPSSYGAVISGGAIANESASVVTTGAASGLPMTVWMLAALLGCKLAGTCLTLGSGGSGGVFAPSLFLGATCGALFGTVLEWVGLIPAGGTPAAYALVGMAALVAGTTHAPLTGILMLFELTRDVYVLLPIMFAAVISTGVARVALRDSIYTLKLRRQGYRVGHAADWTILRRLSVRDVPLDRHVSVGREDAGSTLLEIAEQTGAEHFVVVSAGGEYVGMVRGEDFRTALVAREAIPLLLVDELLRTDLPTVDSDETLDHVMEKFAGCDAQALAVLRREGEKTRVMGLLTRAGLMGRYQQALAEV